MRCFWFSSKLNFELLFLMCKKRMISNTSLFAWIFLSIWFFFFGGSTKTCLVGIIWQIGLGLKAHIWLFKLILYFLPEIHRHLGVGVVFVQMLLARRQDVNTTYDFANLKVKIYANTTPFGPQNLFCPRTSHRFWYPFQCLNNNEISSLPLENGGILLRRQLFRLPRAAPGWEPNEKTPHAPGLLIWEELDPKKAP